MTIDIYTWPGSIGHVALKVNNIKLREDSRYPHTYISWFPDESAALPTLWDRFTKPRETYRAVRVKQPGSATTFREDVYAEMSRSAANQLREGAQQRPGQLLATNRFVKDYQSGQFTSNINDPYISSSRESLRNKDATEIADELNESLRYSVFGGDGSSSADVYLSGDDWVHLPRFVEINGLDEAAIMGWWLAFTRGKNTKLTLGEGDYRFVSKSRNCASMVLRALIAGGADLIKRPPSSVFYYTPPQIESYAKSLSFNRRDVTISGSEDTIPSPEEWRRMSDSSLNVMKRGIVLLNNNALTRSAEMLRLDELIQRSVTISNSDKPALFQDMLGAIGTYLRTKPHGDRTRAVVILAKRIYLALKKPENAACLNLINSGINFSILEADNH